MICIVEVTKCARFLLDWITTSPDVTDSRRVDLSDVPVVDGHGHPLFRDPWTVAPEAFTGLFSEGRSGTMTAHIPHTGYFRRACHDLARRLGT